MGFLGLGRRDAESLAASGKESTAAKHVIFLCLNGGPSHFETFDPKPEAPVGIRGPYHPIATSVPGMFLSETLPRLAQRGDKFSLIRSLSHDAAPIHETGLQLLTTGRLPVKGIPSPTLGTVIARKLGPMGTAAPQFSLPHPTVDQGLQLNPSQIQARTLQAGYGSSRFGRDCYLSARLVEQGTRFVTVNMFESLAGHVTWDCHANSSSSPAKVTDYGSEICPVFDQALSALLDDLQTRGLLQQTLIIAAGEFGRTPRINDAGGRDHWSEVWSGLIAGGGVTGGQIIGSSDARGESPVDQPVSLADLASTMLTALGIDPAETGTYADDATRPLADGTVIPSLLA
ncbi:MAG: DUF1501 domain-containing protein [Planctomycetales bacterium]